MNSALNDIDPQFAQALTTAIRSELLPYDIDESGVSVSGRHEAGAGGVLSIGVTVDGADSNPLLIDTKNFEASLEGQMDVLRAWLRAGHPQQNLQTQTFRFKAGERIPATDTKEAMVASRDSYNSRVWAVSESDYGKSPSPSGPRVEEIPYLILPDGSVSREYQHGLPD